MSAASAILYKERWTRKRKTSPGGHKPGQRVPTRADDVQSSVRVRNGAMQKSASFTFLPHSREPERLAGRPAVVPDDDSSKDTHASLDLTNVSTPNSSGWTTPSEDLQIAPIVIKDLDAELEKLPSIRVADVEKRQSAASSGSSGKELESETDQSPHMKRSSLTSRISRRMSILGSRSPSPSKVEGAPSITPSIKIKSVLKKRESMSLVPMTDKSAQESSEDGPHETKTRRRTILGRKASSTDLGRGLPNHPNVALIKSFSTEHFPSVSEGNQPVAGGSPLPSPRILNTERNTSLSSLALSRKRDELWSVFRQLDGDFAKFSSKSTPFKANVLRQSLLPFLRNYHNHPSNRGLRAEDLDRRTAILTKWWNGLLELLNGKNNQSLSGTDRPAILDGLCGLMDRPEWRPHSSPFCPLAHRGATDTLKNGNKSSTSLASMGSDLLNESVMHNVKNLFMQNLNAQLTFAVEKMCLRNASASLVGFCGKAIAYAFYYCPGIASLLIRMWKIETETLKRVLTEYGINKFDSIEQISQGVLSSFPPATHDLAFTSLSSLTRKLKRPPELQPGLAHLEFYGYWSERWLGRESDLLYVFVKYYTILSNDYLPADASKLERASSPGMILVQSQLLVNLDSTINRISAVGDVTSSSASPTFDDLLEAPDAIVSTLPLLPPNATRAMNENRLIMLLREVLSERGTQDANARQLFAVNFMDMLQASARGISVFNHTACYTLCDFLDQALHIFVNYEQSLTSLTRVIDTSFWIDVFKKMLTSENTVTEIRLYALLYNVWNVLGRDAERKEQIATTLLLDEDFFERSFTHWCPMVRAYFMRLICWRLGRLDEDGTSTDTRILDMLFLRLRQIWAYHVYEREQGSVVAPSSWTACNPAPGRRFLIVRNDMQMAPCGSLQGNYGMIPSFLPGTMSEGVFARRAVLSAESLDRPLSVSSTDSDLVDVPTTESSLRGFLKGIMGGGRKRSDSREAKPRSGSQTPDRSMDGSGRLRSPEKARKHEEFRGSRSASRSPAAQHNRHSFKFSLEFVSRPLMPNAGPQTVPRLLAPRLPIAAMRHLQEVRPQVPVVQPKKPQGVQVARAKYVGRALAEWAAIVGEYQAFFERRRMEGVPMDKFVETPSLGVEVFKRC